MNDDHEWFCTLCLTQWTGFYQRIRGGGNRYGKYYRGQTVAPMFNPSSIRAWRVENEYLALYDIDKGVAGFIFDPASMDIRHITASFDCAYNDESSDTLYITKGKAL
ncbi:hypothetical protein [Candidatus Symbiopectobacterium sp. 'North America']|uniref:hypothetical protein n=1 Tax=Candidatus Symbiopectobacterium sp. 'North America' TaxID=2794574 RepID=UPI0018C910CA|nr:hypothetical protein [Candidatus Symbiopectobacterium sp. 'North America']